MSRLLFLGSLRLTPYIGGSATARTRKSPEMGSRGFCRLMRIGLFLQYHLLSGVVFATGHPVLIHTGRDGFAGAVASIPVDLVVSSSVMGLAKATHQLAAGVVDVDLHIAGFLELVANVGVGVEGVGVGILKSGLESNARSVTFITFDAEDHADGRGVAVGAIHLVYLQPVVIQSTYRIVINRGSCNDRVRQQFRCLSLQKHLPLRPSFA